MLIAVVAVALAQLIALVLWARSGKLPTLWPKRFPPMPEQPSLLAPLLEEIAQLRREIHDERLARAAGVAAERFAGHRAMRLAAEMSRPPLLAVVTEGDRNAISPPPLRPLAFPDSLIGSEDIPDEVASVIGPESGLGPNDDTPPQGIRTIRPSRPQ